MIYANSFKQYKKGITDSRIFSENMLLGTLMNDRHGPHPQHSSHDPYFKGVQHTKVMQHAKTGQKSPSKKHNAKADLLKQYQVQTSEFTEYKYPTLNFLGETELHSKKIDLKKHNHEFGNILENRVLFPDTKFMINGDFEVPSVTTGNFKGQTDDFGRVNPIFDPMENQIGSQKPLRSLHSPDIIKNKAEKTLPLASDDANKIDQNVGSKKKIFFSSKIVDYRHENLNGDFDVCDNLEDDNKDNTKDEYGFEKNDEEKDANEKDIPHDLSCFSVQYDSDSEIEKRRNPMARNLFYKRLRPREQSDGLSPSPGLKHRLMTMLVTSTKPYVPLSTDQMNIFNDSSTCVDPTKISYEVAKSFDVSNSLNSSTSVTIKTYRDSTGSSKYDSLIQRPDNKFRLFWDMLCAILILYQVLMIPLRISFGVDDSYNLLDSIDFSTDIIFLVDILLNFNTGYYSKGILILKRKEITTNYLKTWFWIDLIASFPYSWLAGISISSEQDTNVGLIKSAGLLRAIRIFKFLKVLRLVRILKLKKIFGKVEAVINTSAIINTILGFLKITFIIMVISHWIACVWHFVGMLEINLYSDTWVSRAQIVDSEWTERYITSIYWAVTTMITVGYGDITPVTEVEMIIVIFIELISSGVFAFSMNSINSLLTNMNSATTSYRDLLEPELSLLFLTNNCPKIIVRQTLSTIHHYMKKRQVTPDVQTKIRKYLEFTLDKESSKLDEENLKELLSENLKQELISEINGKILAHSKIFADKFSNSFLLEVSFIMQEKIYGADELIFSEDDTEDFSVYFIARGEIEIFSIDSNSSLQKLKKDRSFGELAFFSGTQRIASARTLAFTELRFITRNDFVRLLEQFPKEREKFCMIKDSINLYNNYDELQISCYSCNKKGHVAVKCPQIHFELQHDILINQYKEAELKFFKQFKRPPRNININNKSDNYYNCLNKAAQDIQNLYQNNPLIFQNNNIQIQVNQPSLPILPLNLEQDYIINNDELKVRVSPREKKDKIDHELKNIENEIMNSKRKLSLPNNDEKLDQSLLSISDGAKDRSHDAQEIENIHDFTLDTICHFNIYFPKNNFKHVHYEMMENERLRRQEAEILQKKTINNISIDPTNYPNIHSNLINDKARMPTLYEEDEECCGLSSERMDFGNSSKNMKNLNRKLNYHIMKNLTISNKQYNDHTMDMTGNFLYYKIHTIMNIQVINKIL